MRRLGFNEPLFCEKIRDVRIFKICKPKNFLGSFGVKGRINLL